jgi:hypothetical protein
MSASVAIIQAVGTGTHKRELRSILTSMEKRVLVWLAERLPPWSTLII